MHENGTFKFLGWSARLTKDEITINQNLYVLFISPIYIVVAVLGARNKNTRKELS